MLMGVCGESNSCRRSIFGGEHIMTSSPLVLVESLSGDCACDREAPMCLNGGRVLVGVPGEGEKSLCCLRGGESQKEESMDLSAVEREGEE